MDEWIQRCSAVIRLHVDTMNWSLHSRWLPPDRSQEWMERCNRDINWEQTDVRVYGRWHKVPRLTAFLAERSVTYRYSGALHHGTGWPQWFLPLLETISSQCNAPFNGCLFNWYRNGEDRMGWHADDEPEIDASFPIASLSLGATRDLHFRHRQTGQRHNLPLCDGDLLLMDPACQSLWMHALPTRRKITTPRLNLTFRVFRTND